MNLEAKTDDYTMTFGYVDPKGEKSFEDTLGALVEYTKRKKIAPIDGGLYVLRIATITEEQKAAAFKMGVLVNPTRGELLHHSPRTVYYSEHQFDEKDEDGGIVIEKEEVFWKKHEERYQEWVKGLEQW